MKEMMSMESNTSRGIRIIPVSYYLNLSGNISAPHEYLLSLWALAISDSVRTLKNIIVSNICAD
jgi:hypothetical protein